MIVKAKHVILFVFLCLLPNCKEKRFRTVEIDVLYCSKCADEIRRDTSAVIIMTEREITDSNKIQSVPYRRAFDNDTTLFDYYRFSGNWSPDRPLCGNCSAIKTTDDQEKNKYVARKEKSSYSAQSKDVGAEVYHIAGIDDGYKWNRAVYTAKINLCNDIANRVGKYDGQFYYDVFEEFYSSDDPNILSQRISTIAGMATAMREQ